MVSYSEGGVTSKVISKGDNNQLTLFCMAEKTDISEHTSTKEGFVYVIEGSGMFNLEGEEISMKPGILIRMCRDAKHSIKAIENTSFLLFLSE
tara:strand:+ start:473 stop:751 length:279 start_codon:yes stop_codon:yes gene_type:complete